MATTCSTPSSGSCRLGVDDAVLARVGLEGIALALLVPVVVGGGIFLGASLAHVALGRSRRWQRFVAWVDP